MVKCVDCGFLCYRDTRNELKEFIRAGRRSGTTSYDIVCFVDANDLEADAKEYGCPLNDLLCDYNRALNYISTGHFEDRPPYHIYCQKRIVKAQKAAAGRWDKMLAK